MKRCTYCLKEFPDDELIPLLMWPQLKQINYYCKEHYPEIKAFQDERIKGYEDLKKRHPDRY